jgi:hypothetical protein
MGESRSLDVDFCFSKWTRKTLQWIILAFIVYVTLKWPFIWFFDTMLTEIGFLYVYMWALPEAAILYFVAFRLRVRWTSTFITGLAGIIGAPIDYYYEWVVQSNLSDPIFAFMESPQGNSLVYRREELRSKCYPCEDMTIFFFAALCESFSSSYTMYTQPIFQISANITYAVFFVPY